VVVGAFGGHTPATYSGACNSTADGSLARAECNLNVYEEAVKTAQSSGVDLLVLPEYGLINGGRNCHTEATPSVGSQPCGSSSPQMSRLSCLAQTYSVALAANVITSSGGNKHITEIIYDKNGTVKATYDKHRLFPGEGGWFGWADAGPYQPTVVDLLGRKWGLVICWEGMDPTAGWGQFNSFHEQGAHDVIWSVGNTMIGGLLTGNAENIASQMNMNVVATMNLAGVGGTSVALVNSDAGEMPTSYAVLDESAVSALGYGGSAFIAYSTLV